MLRGREGKPNDRQRKSAPNRITNVYPGAVYTVYAINRAGAGSCDDVCARMQHSGDYADTARQRANGLQGHKIGSGKDQRSGRHERFHGYIDSLRLEKTEEHDIMTELHEIEASVGLARMQESLAKEEIARLDELISKTTLGTKKIRMEELLNEAKIRRVESETMLREHALKQAEETKSKTIDDFISATALKVLTIDDEPAAIDYAADKLRIVLKIDDKQLKKIMDTMTEEQRSSIPGVTFEVIEYGGTRISSGIVNEAWKSETLMAVTEVAAEHGADSQQIMEEIAKTACEEFCTIGTAGGGWSINQWRGWARHSFSKSEPF